MTLRKDVLTLGKYTGFTLIAGRRRREKLSFTAAVGLIVRNQMSVWSGKMRGTDGEGSGGFFGRPADVAQLNRWPSAEDGRGAAGFGQGGARPPANERQAA